MILPYEHELTWPSTWDEGIAFAQRLVDGMGCPIDEGILEVVVSFNLLGLRTCQSCEGHLDDGLPYPWIDFETDEFPAFQQALEEMDRDELSDEEKEEKGEQLFVLAEALTAHGRGRLYTHLEQLLDDYYEQFPTIPEEWRMGVRWCSPILFRLMPFCGCEAKDWPETVRAENLARTQAEMRALGVWLREHWREMRANALALATGETRHGAR